MGDLIASIKKAALDAVNAANPVTLVFGKVKSVDPFEIDVDQKLLLTEEFVVIGQYVKEYSLDLTIEGEMWHGFRVDDELLLFRMQGGQKYCIIDFIKRVDEGSRPAHVMVGEVVSNAPEIKVNEYLTLSPEQLIVCRNVTEYQTEMTTIYRTETETYEVRNRYTVHNGLVVGDKVLLVCERVTQKWYVVDFISRVPIAAQEE